MNTKAKVLVIGATGKTGQPVVEQAIAAGLDVRAVIRREDDRSERLRQLGAETVLADVHDLRSLREVTKGVDRVYFAYPPQLERLVEATANIAIAAKDAGVTALVNMSQVTARESARSPLSHQHWLSEHIFDASGLGAIHIRPTFFAENLLLFSSATIASEGKIYLPYGTKSHAPIAAADIARAVVHLLVHPEGHAGERIRLTGPELLTIHEMANIIGLEIGRPVEYVDLPAEQWREILMKQVGLPKFLARHLYYVALDHQEGIFEVQTDKVAQLTGKPSQSLATFVHNHAAQFKGQEAVFLGV